MESVYDTMFFTVVRDINKKGDFQNFIVPLSDVKIVQKGNKTVVESPFVCPEKLQGRFHSAAIGISDDPYTEDALDWAHLGCFKMVFNCKNADVRTLKDRVRITCDTKNFGRPVYAPDRTP